MSIFDQIPEALADGAFEITIRVARYDEGKPAAYMVNVLPHTYGKTGHRGFAIFRTPEAALKHALERHRTGEGAAPPRNSTPVLDVPVEAEPEDDLLDLSNEDLLG